MQETGDLPSADKREAMNDKYEPSTEAFGLLANGCSARWDITVDESLERDEWSLEIDGPQTYLVFQLQDLDVLQRALDFLRAGPGSKQVHGWHGGQDNEGALSLGRFGSASVSLAWDNEEVPRCFIVIGPRARSTMRVTLDAEDIKMVIEALDQVVQDLPEVPGN
jgi:hypothetical protein